MSGHADIYVLAPERSGALVSRFLQSFAPRREFSAEEFAVRGADGTERFFTSCDVAVEFCTTSPQSSTALYWRSLAPPPFHLMAFFLSDGHLVLGVSTAECEAQHWLARLRELVGASSPGYITFEQSPPDSVAEFCAMSHTHAA